MNCTNQYLRGLISAGNLKTHKHQAKIMELEQIKQNPHAAAMDAVFAMLQPSFDAVMGVERDGTSDDPKTGIQAISEDDEFEYRDQQREEEDNRYVDPDQEHIDADNRERI